MWPRAMLRRAFLVSLCGSLLGIPAVASAQKRDKVARVGILNFGASPSPQELARSVATNPFWSSMRQLGWVYGQNVIVERRFGESTEQLRQGAADLVRLNVDVLFVGSAGLAKILQLSTRSIPIVVGRAEGDLVAAGLVESLARPGGNVTGSQVLNDDLVPKRLELLKALIPHLARVAVVREGLTDSALPEVAARYEQLAVVAARTLHVDVHTVVVRGVKDLTTAFADMARNRDHGVLVTSSNFMFARRQTVVDLAATHRIAAVYELPRFVQNGGLMSYGVDSSEMERRAAAYVDRILRGAKAAELPVEQPTKFNLAINLKTARALGLTVPPTVLARADEVVQ